MTTDDFSAWIGRTETVHDDLAHTQLLAAAATFDEPMGGPTDNSGLTQTGPIAIPPLWHWFYFLPRAPQHQLSVDGHPERGNFMPPVPLPRRMFAGSRVEIHAPLHVGVPARREGVIRHVAMKSGKSGRLAFVTVGYTIWQGDTVCIEEEQDIVYREPGSPVPAPAAMPLAEPTDGSWWREITPDARLLFRFSALTFNAHRIHYDREYAMREEGYPGLVVHGPLNAVLLANLVRTHTAQPIAAFSFRGIGPLFDLAPYRLVAAQEENTVSCEAIAPDGRVAIQATARLVTTPTGYVGHRGQD
ncbi:MAG: acyl-CoA dehydrogenase [Gemmatimonadaceae bacterium]|jgi:3-methylfumaryl-CoA hydratase|nr:acyl-CoA dehydrogenase [Gemmatimonadaceae bacterium]